MKKTTKKSPTGAPLGNPLKFFREGGEKIKTMFKKGGYNTPTQSLTKKYNGGPGSGMGSMYAADQAYDSMMSEPAPTVVRPTPKMIDPRKYPSGPKRLPPILDDPGSIGTPPSPSTPYPSYIPPNPMNILSLPKDALYKSMENPSKPTPYKKLERKSSVNRGNPRGKDGGMMYKKGGATKATKFAALAPPFNKATAADRIAGAKKNVRKKK